MQNTSINNNLELFKYKTIIDFIIMKKKKTPTPDVLCVHRLTKY